MNVITGIPAKRPKRVSVFRTYSADELTIPIKDVAPENAEGAIPLADVEEFKGAWYMMYVLELHEVDQAMACRFGWSVVGYQMVQDIPHSEFPEKRILKRPFALLFKNTDGRTVWSDVPHWVMKTFVQNAKCGSIRGGSCAERQKKSAEQETKNAERFQAS